MSTGWQWLLVRNVQVGDLYYLLHLGFYQQRLSHVALVVSPTPFAFSATWGGWSEEVEIRKLAALKQWVRAETGQEGDFALLGERSPLHMTHVAQAVALASTTTPIPESTTFRIPFSPAQKGSKVAFLEGSARRIFRMGNIALALGSFESDSSAKL